MKQDSQNPYADIIINSTPSFIVRYGLLYVCMFLMLCILIGYKIMIPQETKKQVFIKQFDTYGDTLRLSFNVNYNDIFVFNHNNQNATLQIVNNLDGSKDISNYALNRLYVCNNNIIVAEVILDKYQLQTILSEIHKDYSYIYIINKMDDISLPKYLFESLFSLYTIE